MKIAVCDDDRIYIEEVCHMLEKYENTEVHTFDLSEDLMKSTEAFDIAFIDVEMNSYDGFDVVQSLYQKNPKCILVLYSSHCIYAVKGYKYNIFRYMLKSDRESNKCEAVEDAISEYYRRNAVLQSTYKGKDVIIPLHTIYYVESQSKTMRIYTTDGEYDSNRKLCELEQYLKDYQFVRCHKSFIVNVKCVSAMGDKELELNNGKTIPIGRVYKQDTKVAYVKYR